MLLEWVSDKNNHMESEDMNVRYFRLWLSSVNAAGS